MDFSYRVFFMIIVGNWKMNLVRSESRKLAHEVSDYAKNLSHVEAWMTPAALSIESTVEFQHDRCKIGAQNSHWENSGAFTGELSAPMLKDIGVSFVIIGHSERRQYFNESDATVQQRASKALEHGLQVIICIGETLQERETGSTEKVLKRQITEGFNTEWCKRNALQKNQEPVLVAYEPVWAIGTGKVATILEIEKTHFFIRETLNKLGFSSTVPILYGGSVKPQNFAEIAAIQEVGGALVGGASLESDSFCSLLKIADTLSR
jgi:triosephosphate isomerase (TIM)